MGKVNFKELQKGNMYQDVYALIRRVEEKITSAGKAYLVLSVTDGENDITAKMWNMSLDCFGLAPGEMICMELQVGEFNGALDFTIRGNRSVSPDEADRTEYVPHAPVPAEKMYKDILDTVGTITDAALKNVTTAILTEHREKLLVWGAAEKMHHAYLGGLLYHTYRMLQMGVCATKIYRNLNRNLVIAGIILHDIGKLCELETDQFGDSTYTTVGNLETHLVIGADMIRDAAMKIHEEKNPRIMELRHIILSHHEKPEFGAAVVPKMQEALLVAFIDNLDARMEMFDKVLGEPGTVSTDKVFGLGNIHPYTAV